MSDTAIATNGAALWTLEEICRLVSHSGDSAETLSNVVQFIRGRFQTDVCSVYLLEPDRTRLVLAATHGLRPESVGRMRMRLDEGLVGLVAEELRPQLIEDAFLHPRFKYFGETGEDPFRSFLGVPLVDHGLLQGVLVVQTAESRKFSPEEVRLLVAAGTQLAPIVAEARMLGQFVAPAHQQLKALAQNLWWSWDEEAIGLFRDLDPVLWRQLDHNPIALLKQISAEKLEERASQLALHSRINYTYRRFQEYTTRPRPGARGTRRALVATGGVFLGRIRHPRVAADLFGRVGSLVGRPHQECLRSEHSADRHRTVLWPRLFQAAIERRTVGRKKTTSTPTARYCRSSRPQVPMASR